MWADWWRVSKIFKHFSNLCVVIHCTHINMLHIVAIVDCTQVELATASFDAGVILHRKKLHPIFWLRISYILRRTWYQLTSRENSTK